MLIKYYTQSQTSKLMQQNIERFGNTRLGHWFTLDYGFICLGPSYHIVGFDCKYFLKNMSRHASRRLQEPDFHF